MIADNKLVLKTARMLIQDIDELESIEKAVDFEKLFGNAASNLRSNVVGGVNRARQAVRSGANRAAGAIGDVADRYIGKDAPRSEYVNPDGTRTASGAAEKGSQRRKRGLFERLGIATAKKAGRGLNSLVDTGEAAAGAVGRGVQTGREAVGRGVQAGKDALGRGVDAVAGAAYGAAGALDRGVQAGRNAIQAGRDAVGRGVNAAAGAAYDAAGAVDRGVRGAKDAYGRAKNAVNAGIDRAAMGAVDAIGGAEQAVNRTAGKARRGLGGWLSTLGEKLSGNKSGQQKTDSFGSGNLMAKPETESETKTASIVSFIDSRVRFYEKY